MDKKEMFSKSELKQYSRQIILPELGLAGQEKLKQAKVLVIGAGGLGCPVLQYLAAAGVGKLGIVDHDVVDESNLHRQILFNSNDIGKSKALVASEKISSQNFFVTAEPYILKLAQDNAKEIFSGYDIVIDCSDNFETRYLINDTCVILDIPFISGSVFKFEGQLSVFNYKNGPDYRSVFPEAPEDTMNCAEIGVLGVLPGIIGTLQANEAIKIITGIGEILSGKLLIFDSLTMDFILVQIKKSVIKKDFENVAENSNGIKEITSVQLQEKLQSRNPPQIIDVREDYEFAICSLDSDHIPLNEIPGNTDRISKDKDVVFLCHHGMRSWSAIKYLQENFEFKNLYNLKGGIHAWAEEVDRSMNKY
jgi:sulfur-carrier protein adenylyltransferase/sulfurtransferase